MRAIRKMQRVIAALFILVLLAFCGLRIYRRLTVDVTPPVITCSSGSIDVSVTAGDEALLQGVMASDDRDGDLTDQILIKGVSPSLTDSSAQVTYIVFDSANNMATVTRTVRYTDYEAPRFALSQPLVYPAGQTVTLLDRLTATDVLDGDISSGIRITSQNVINSQPGGIQRHRSGGQPPRQLGGAAAEGGHHRRRAAADHPVGLSGVPAPGIGL